jgi:hypothetical protein
MRFIKIRPSAKPEKKYDATFETDAGRTKTVSFGAAGMSDYTKNKDPERKERYLDRHRANENWNDPDSPGALSRWILWNKPTLVDSIKDYKRRFGFD